MRPPLDLAPSPSLRSTPRSSLLGRAPLLAVLLALPVAGCLLIPPRSSAPPQVEVKMLGQARAPIDAAGVAAIANAGELPRGLLFVRMADGRRKLYAVPDYPAADDAHHVIAALGALGGGYTRPDVLHRAFADKAAQLGANAVFTPEPGARYAYAVYVSRTAAGPGAGERDPRALLAARAGELSGYRPVGEPVRHPLGAAPADELPIRRGRCYAVAVALADGARLGDDGERHLVFEMSSRDPLMLSTSHMPKERVGEFEGAAIEAPIHGRYVHLRSFAAEMGCAWQNGGAVIALRTRGRSPRIGDGDYFVQVFERRISDSELSAKKRAMDVAMAEAEARAREQERIEQARRAEREREREAERARREAERGGGGGAGGGGSGGGPAQYSFSLKNECRQTVKMFINDGGNPRFSGGTSTSIGANTIRSFSGFAPKTFWIVDDRGEGMSSFTASGGQRDMRIVSSCTGFAPR